MNEPTDASAENTPGRRPDYIAYNVQESRDGKGYFHRIGAAWRHRDGQGYDVALDSMPLNGRVTLREQREERMQEYDDQRRDQTEDRRSEQTRSRSYSRGRLR